MTTLLDYCSLVRSKNAGPFTLTLDFMCNSRASYDRLLSTGFLVPSLFSSLYGVPSEHVILTRHVAALAIKVSLPRPTIQGSLADADSYAGQQYGPLMSMEILDEHHP